MHFIFSTVLSLVAYNYVCDVHVKVNTIHYDIKSLIK